MHEFSFTILHCMLTEHLLYNHRPRKKTKVHMFVLVIWCCILAFEK